jgi:hypothetical protein
MFDLLMLLFNTKRWLELHPDMARQLDLPTY